MRFCSLWQRLQNSLALNSDIQGSFKKLLLFGQAEMVFVVIWFLDHFTVEPFPSVNGDWIITFVSHFHVWITKFKPSLMFFRQPVLTSHNTLSKHPRRAMCLFTMRSSISSLSLKISCWWASFVNWRTGIWLSRLVMACWCSSCIFSTPFLVKHLIKATAQGFLERTAINEYIMTIFCPPKGVGHTGALYFRPGVDMVRWKLLEVISYIPYA